MIPVDEAEAIIREIWPSAVVRPSRFKTEGLLVVDYQVFKSSKDAMRTVFGGIIVIEELSDRDFSFYEKTAMSSGYDFLSATTHEALRYALKNYEDLRGF